MSKDRDVNVYLLPSLARSVNESPSGYGFLLGSFGLGAVVGAVTLQRVRSSWPTDVVVSGAIAVVAVAIIAVSAIRQYWILLVVVLVAGAGWVLFNSVMNVLLLQQAPDWVRARVLAASQLVLQGAIAAGTALWGFVGQRAGLSTAFLIAGVCLLATTVLSLFLLLQTRTWIWRVGIYGVFLRSIAAFRRPASIKDGFLLLSNTKFRRSKGRDSSPLYTNTAESGAVTAPWNGISFRTLNSRSATWRLFCFHRGTSICDSMSA